MLSISQRAKLLSVIPTDLADLTIKLLRKDRFGNDDFEFPSMRFAVLSEGIRMRPTTHAPIRKDYLGDNGDARQWLGQHQQASISLTVMAESTSPKTDQDTPEVLDQILYDLQTEIELYRLGLVWPLDYMKVVPGSGKVNYLPPFQAKGASDHWIYPAVYDFKIEYEFNVLDDTPNIHIIDYDFGIPEEEPLEHIYLTDVHPPWYTLDICIRGWRSTFDMDTILFNGIKTKNFGCSIILVND
jgi:hypothetical protein